MSNTGYGGYGGSGSGVTNGDVPARMLTAVGQLLVELREAWQKPAGDAAADERHVERVARAILGENESTRRLVRLDAIPRAGRILVRESRYFPSIAVLCEAVYRASDELRAAERQAGRSTARRENVNPDRCEVCGAEYTQNSMGQMTIDHQPEPHGFRPTDWR